MKYILLFIAILISSYSFSQENIQELIKEQERLEDLARSAYYEKDGKLLFYDIFDQSDRWGFRENMTADELRAYIKDLDQVKAKWEAPNGPLELALSRVDNFHAYNDKLCTTYGAVKTANSDHTTDWCKIRDDYKRTYPRKSAAYENAMGYWQRFYDYANELLEKKGSNSSGNSSSDSSNSSSTSTSSNAERTNTSNIETREERIKRLDRERGEQITRETQNNVARVKANSEQFGNNLNNIISSVFSKDRSNEAIIRNKYDENKAFISNYDKEYEAYQQALEEERISEISFFKDFSENPENAKLIIEIQKSFEIGYCTNRHCENGYVKDTKLTLCDSTLDGCNGKGYVEVGAFIPIGQTAHPNDGKEKHEKCNGSGVLEKTNTTRCQNCNVNYNKAINYVGNSNYSTSFLNEFKKKYREEIYRYLRIRDEFSKDYEKKYTKLVMADNSEVYLDRTLSVIELNEEEVNNLKIKEKVSSSNLNNYFTVLNDKNKIDCNENPKCQKAQSILSNYIKAIGGEKIIESINNYSILSSNTNSINLEATEIRQKGDNYKMVISFDDQEISKLILFNGLGFSESNGIGEKLSDNKYNTSQIMGMFFPELHKPYLATYEGEKLYKGQLVNVIRWHDLKESYYDVSTSLLVAEKLLKDENIIEYSNYKESFGIKFPNTISNVIGGLIFTTEVKNISINLDLDENNFK